MNRDDRIEYDESRVIPLFNPVKEMIEKIEQEIIDKMNN